MTAQGLKRKLRAILNADVKGYSRLMRDDEESTIRTLTTYRAAITKLIQQYRGRVVDTPGDNILADFTSVVDAVNCAVEVQRELAERNAELPENRRMEFRIGVNLGDVVEEGERIYGDGVNIAARVEGLAEGGGICISGTVYDAVETKIGLEYEYLGEQEVKNIAKPVRVYRVLSFPGAAPHRVIKAKKAAGKTWRNVFVAIVAVLVVGAAVAVWHFYFRPPTMEPASLEKMAYPLPDKPSIAVLAFTNMSGDPEQEYFSDGLTEEIITTLSKASDLFVIARHSTFTYKGKSVKVQHVSRELGVRYVLEGSVRKVGERVRITAQLIDASTGNHLWAERYDRELKDIFAVQDEITEKILTALEVKLTKGQQAFLYRKGTQNVEAYLKYLQWRKYFLRVTKEDNALARQMAEKAIALDPNFALAYAVLGFTHMVDAQFGWSKSRRESVDRALKLAQKASALDETHQSSCTLLSFIYLNKRQYEKSISVLKRGIELSPSWADAHAHLAGCLYNVGRGEEAVVSAERAIRLNPMPPGFYFDRLGMGHWVLGQYEEAIEALKKALHRKFMAAHIPLTASYSLLGRDEEARAEASEVLRIYPEFSLERYSKAILFKNESDTERYIKALRKAGLK